MEVLFIGLISCFSMSPKHSAHTFYLALLIIGNWLSSQMPFLLKMDTACHGSYDWRGWQREHCTLKKTISPMGFQHSSINDQCTLSQNLVAQQAMLSVHLSLHPGALYVLDHPPLPSLCVCSIFHPISCSSLTPVKQAVQLQDSGIRALLYGQPSKATQQKNAVSELGVFILY